MEMKEKNHKILAEALQKLPRHRAPEESWDKITKVLESPEEDALRESLKSLPQYEAPASAWEEVQGQLKGQSPKIFSTRWMLAAAIGLFLLATLAVWLLNQPAEIPQAPMAEKKSTAQISEIQQAAFENPTAAEEAKLNTCMNDLDLEALAQETQKEIKQLETLTQTRDSLSNLLVSGKGRSGTSPRLDKLNERRKILLDGLAKKLCQPASP